MHTQASKQPAKKLRSFSLATYDRRRRRRSPTSHRARRRRCQDGELLDRSIDFRRDGDSSPNTAWRNRGTRARPPAARRRRVASVVVVVAGVAWPGRPGAEETCPPGDDDRP